jgi:hypothetical protein
LRLCVDPLLAAVLACGLILTPGAAHAEPAEPRARAKALLREGARYMEDRRYDKALETFQEAYALVPSPKIQFNLGIAYLSLARYTEALSAFEQFLKDAREAPASSHATARRHIADLRAKVATVEISGDRQTVDIAIDGRSRGSASVGQELTVDPGRHELHATAGGKSVHLHFSIEAGQRQVVSLIFDPPPPPLTTPLPSTTAPPAAAPAPALLATTAEASSQPTVARRPLHRRPWFWVAAGGVLAAATTVILVLALGRTEYPAVDARVPGP